MKRNKTDLGSLYPPGPVSLTQPWIEPYLAIPLDKVNRRFRPCQPLPFNAWTICFCTVAISAMPSTVVSLPCRP
jgi:hypothetical protein